MTLPLYQTGAFGFETGLAVAVFIGFWFGFVLERSGFGQARNMINQFYLVDMRVLKVMFTAIVTAMIGLGVLGAMGVVDMGALAIPPTFLWAQLAGGLLLGVGFAVSGYCPGTAAVGLASGRSDALFALVGILAGSLAFGFAYPAIEGLYLAGDHGVFTFVDLTGLPWTVLALAVTAMATGAFWAAERGEEWANKREGTQKTRLDPAMFGFVLTRLGLVAVVGVALLALPRSEAAVEPTAAEPVSAVALADRLVADPTAQWVVDLRDPATCAAARIPGALCLPEGDADAAMITTLPRTRDLVLYGADDVAVPESARSFGGHVLVLDGGYAAFDRDVLTEPAPPETPTSASIADFSWRYALHAYFAGVDVTSAPVIAAPVAVERVVKKGGGC